MTVKGGQVLDRSKSRIICACFDVTESDVRKYFAAPEARIDAFVEATGISTKCTACKMDFELLLESIRTRGDNMPVAEVHDRAAAGNSARDMVDSGFLINRDGIRTVVRVDNASNAFDPESETRLTSYVWRTRILDEQGRLCDERSDELAVGASLTLDLAAERRCPDLGWFWIWLSPKGAGFFGATRPQFALIGPNWAASVHTQPHAMACRRKSVIIQAPGEGFNTRVSIINGYSRRRAECEFVLGALDGSTALRKNFSIASNGSKLVDIDALFPEAGGTLRMASLTVHSDVPVRKHIIKVQPSGRYSIDHFPSVK
jgi:bacterioferritin-associated ferredoxin